MRFIKAIVLFCFSVGIVSACFEAPEMSVIPKISPLRPEFKQGATVADNDTLTLVFNFEDGDGNLGLRPDAPEDFAVPFHSAVYYVADGLGDTTGVIPRKIGTYDVFDESNLPSFPGKLVTNRLRIENPNYSYLPAYNTSDPLDCANYSKSQFAVLSTLGLIDATYNIIDTLIETSGGQSTGRRYYLVEEPFYYKSNPYHNNIEVRFYRFESGSYVEYDFFERQCISYDGRFPVLKSTEPGPATQGIFRYFIARTSLVPFFASDSWRITVRIRDRALNQSNLAVFDFDLDDIRN